MYFADASLRDVQAPFVSLSMNPVAAHTLFAAESTGFADVSSAADASRPLPRLALNTSLRGRIAATQRAVSSPNIVARLPGADPRLRAEHIVFSAHPDHLGMTTTAGGDRVFNGAMDNSAGVAGLLDIARSYRARGAKPKRSMLFVFLTAEEKGLLGSRYFTLKPTVAKRSIVANLNFDMALPIFPLRSVIALGAEENSLGAVAADVGRATNLPLAADPFPDRNSFVRSDQATKLPISPTSSCSIDARGEPAGRKPRRRKCDRPRRLPIGRWSCPARLALPDGAGKTSAALR